LWHNQRVQRSWRTTSREDLLKELERQQQEIERLERARRDVERQRDRLRRERDRLRERVDRLEDELDAARRAGFRQAAPFSKGAPRAAPRRPGRKPGSAYGRKAHRAIPARVHEHHEAPLPPACPHCGGRVRRTRVASQYQEDLPPVQPIVRAFAVHIGRCADCGRRVQGRHPLQTSDALGAASAQLGPQAVALAAVLNKQLGLSVGKVTVLLRERFGLRVTSGGVVQALQRAARHAQPTYTSLRDQVRGSPVVTPDETGWKVAGRLHWLWAFVTPTTTVYAIEDGRGFDEAAATLGADFDGVLVRDGWAPYRRFDQAMHQTCLAHLLRRCRTLQHDHDEHHFAPRVQALLQAGLDVRDRWRAETISDHGVAVARGRLANRLNTLIDDPGPHRLAQTFAAHLAVELPAVFTFLLDPSIDATNWRAEQALRPAVVTRKVWGGNRTPRGARTQHVLASVLRTIQQRDLDAAVLLSEILRAPKRIVPLALTGVPQ
jgi:transposase